MQSAVKNSRNRIFIYAIKYSMPHTRLSRLAHVHVHTLGDVPLKKRIDPTRIYTAKGKFCVHTALTNKTLCRPGIINLQRCNPSALVFPPPKPNSTFAYLSKLLELLILLFCILLPSSRGRVQSIHGVIPRRPEKGGAANRFYLLSTSIFRGNECGKKETGLAARDTKDG